LTYTIVKLLDELADLANEWRGTKRADIIPVYQQALRDLMALGYHKSLSMDSELPDEYMPYEYLAQFE
jgi:hypothetical protein